MDEMERTARNHRGEVAAAEQAQAERANAFAQPTWSRRRDALAGHWGKQVRGIAAAISVVAFLLIAIALFETSLLNPFFRLLPHSIQESSKTVVLFILVGLGSGVAAGMFAILYVTLDDAIALVRRAALRRWPKIDCEQYLTQLGEPWQSPVVHVRMVFKDAWTDQARRDAVDAAKEWMSAPTHFEWTDDRTLELTTDTLDTRFLLMGGRTASGGFEQRNWRIHDATTALLQCVARQLALHAPVERVELEITGDRYLSEDQATTRPRNRGWVQVVGATVSLAAIPFFIMKMDYRSSPQTSLEHVHFSRSDAEMAKPFNLPPNDHIHLEFHQIGKHFLVDSVDLTHTVQHDDETWGFDLKLASSSDAMRVRAASLLKGDSGADSEPFDSPSGSLRIDIDHHRIVGSDLTSPEAANAFWTAALYVIYDSSKPSAEQLDLINQAKPVGSTTQAMRPSRDHQRVRVKR